MPIPQRSKRPEPARNLKLILHVIMGLLYLASGILLWFQPEGKQIIAKEYVRLVSGALVLYGIFRLFRAHLQFSNPRF